MGKVTQPPKTLGAVMSEKKISDADLGQQAGLARGQIWAYRTRRKAPKVPAALAVLKALKEHHGVEMTIEELLGLPPPAAATRKGGRSSKAA